MIRGGRAVGSCERFNQFRAGRANDGTTTSRELPLATHGGVPKSDLRLLTGADLLREYWSSPTTTRSFCSQCGSQLFWQKGGEDWVAVSLGTLDTPFEPRKQRHIHVGSKATWFAIHDNWPQSESL